MLRVSLSKRVAMCQFFKVNELVLIQQIHPLLWHFNAEKKGQSKQEALVIASYTILQVPQLAIING